jgi:OFA family oxalate/formate antiporter-like MFS transporter
VLVTRVPFFYGWLVVATAVASAGFMVGTSIFSIAVYANPMHDELGWSRSALFGALAIRLTAGALIAPFVGAWSDRAGGARWVMAISSFLLAGSLIPLKWIDSLPMYYLVFGIVGAAGSAATGSVMLGIVPKWFQRRRTNAIAFAAAGGALGPLLFPVINAELLRAVGWRDGWFYLGIFTLAILLPLSLLVHRRPEDVGLTPDGDPIVVPTASGPEVTSERSFTLREALHHRSFWLVTASTGLGLFAMNSWQPSWIAFLQGAGFSLRVAANSVLVFGVFSFSARFIWRLAVERFPLHQVLLIELGLAAFGVWLLFGVSGIPMLFLWSVFYGVAWGGFWLLQPLMLANYFGSRHLGAIRGINQPFLAVASGVGPLLAAVVFDATGEYTWVLGSAAIGGGIAAVLGFFARAPRTQTQAADTGPPLDTGEARH